MHGCDILESSFLAFKFSGDENDANDADEEVSFGQLKEEMKIVQASLHTLAEENIAFKSDNSKRPDALKLRVEKYGDLSQRFKSAIEKFCNTHLKQRDTLQASLDELTNGTYLAISTVESKEYALEIDSTFGRKTVYDYLREVSHEKEGGQKAELIHILLDDMKKVRCNICLLYTSPSPRDA